ncbi:MAG TPA: hydantoinase B/oxoprolinase family protein [Solirubrobacteraceae bacterium]|nr:hydantoinase B/oxoprolinase family protein [Solirubrobacteraceae bacterium]
MTTSQVAAPGELRELSDDEFAARYGCDRFTASVLSSRYRYIIKHMCAHLMTNAFSPVLREWYDFAATISGARDLDYPMAAVSDSLMLFSGTMSEAVRNTAEEFGPDELDPGDVLMCNDPVRTGTHPNDVLFSRPVFHDGLLIGYVSIQAHMLDMGGTVPGGFSPNKQTIYENGLVIPPMLFCHRDQPVRPAFSLILDNARFGEIMLPDFLSILADLRLGERLLLDAVDRYGLDAHRGSLRYVTDVSAEAMRAAIAAVPDGVYEGEDMIDCDGIDDSEQYVFRAAVKVAGDRVEVDFSGTSRQARTCINSGWLDTRMAVAVALKFLLDPITPFSSGVYRHIDIVLPPATIACAMPPDGAIMLNFEASEAVLNAIFRALARALGPRAVAGDLGSGMAHACNGLRGDGSVWATVGSCGGENGPWGATSTADGENSLTLYLSNCIAPSVEQTESDVPVLVTRREYAIDTAGPGTHRGGAATQRDTVWLTDGDHYPNVMHVRRPSGFGVNGGGDGTGGAVWLWPASGTDGEPPPAGFTETDPETYAVAEPVAGIVDPDTHVLDPDGTYFHCGRRPVWRISPGSVFRYQTNAGGGWGDPFRRPAERVLRDVRDEYVSVGAARDLYGVVIVGDPVGDPEGLRIDQAATDALRDNPDREETHT